MSFPFVDEKWSVFPFLVAASERQRASASDDDAPSCQIHGAQSGTTAGEQQPCHTSRSRPASILLCVLIGTHVFINPFLHLLIYLLNKNSCSLEGGSKYCLDHICWHPRFNLASVMNWMHALWQPQPQRADGEKKKGVKKRNNDNSMHCILDMDLI